MLAVTGQGWLGSTLSSCFTAWVLALALTVPAYALKRLGGGDIKLLAAMGLTGGMEAMLTAYVVASFLVGGAAIVWVMAYRWGSLLTVPLARIGLDAPSMPEPKGRMLPFGLGLAIGFVVALLFLGAQLSFLPIRLDE